MSKISIKPADTGTATFTIEAPATNTNRTLTLPDGAGTILSDTSTIDSNNLQSDVYKQSNILGTVSESSGVPTGAIIERGSNANGEFVKYADGTLICETGNLSPSRTGAANGTIGALSGLDITLPANFTGTPNASFSMRGPTTAATTLNLYSLAYAAGRSANQVRFYYRGSDTTREPTRYPSMIAIGRWY